MGPRAGLAALAGCTASALLFALYVRVEWPWFALGWIALVPWLAVLDRTASLRGALAVGLLMSEAFTLAVFWWFIGAIAGYADAPWPTGLAVVLLTAPLIQPQFLVCAATRHLARARGAGRWRTALIAAAAYVGAEWALPKLFGDTIGHAFLASRLLRQAADLVGAHGLTFVLVLANECVLIIARHLPVAPASLPTGPAKPTRATALQAIAVLVALVVGLAAYGALRLRQLSGDRGADITAAAVQADISHYDRLAAEIGTYDAVRLILDAHIAWSDSALARARPDLLIWPETVYPTTFGAPKSPDGAAFDREIAAFVERADVPLVFGTYDQDGEREYNAAVALTPGADRRPSAGIYRKAELFPFTERVPALLDSDALRSRMPWLGTWQPGGGAHVLDVRLRSGDTLRLAPLICYDAVNPSLALAAVRDGAQLLVTLSNDSWFADGNGPRLHLAVSAFRSIETRRAQVRATNTGISAIIDASGELLDTLAVHQRGALTGTVRTGGGWTLMLAWGDWFGAAALLLGTVLAGGVLLAWRRDARRRQPPT
jgi:apolipoprotein N-acyltransferase